MNTWLLSNKRLLTFLCAFVGLIFTLTYTGCGLVMHGRYQDVPIESIPGGATVKVDSWTELGDVTTPVTLPLYRGRSHTIHISKEGYEGENAVVTSHRSAWFWWNIFAGPLFMGYIIDAATGGGRKLKPKEINVTLTKIFDDHKISDENKSIPQEGISKESLPGVEQELDKLEKMKKEGKITEDEYKIMRKKIIERY